MPISSDQIRAAMTSSSVLRKAPATSSLTWRRLRIERPRSPWSALER